MAKAKGRATWDELEGDMGGRGAQWSQPGLHELVHHEDLKILVTLVGHSVLVIHQDSGLSK